MEHALMLTFAGVTAASFVPPLLAAIAEGMASRWFASPAARRHRSVCAENTRRPVAIDGR